TNFSFGGYWIPALARCARSRVGLQPPRRATRGRRRVLGDRRRPSSFTIDLFDQRLAAHHAPAAYLPQKLLTAFARSATLANLRSVAAAAMPPSCLARKLMLLPAQFGSPAPLAAGAGASDARCCCH